MIRWRNRRGGAVFVALFAVGLVLPSAAGCTGRAGGADLSSSPSSLSPSVAGAAVAGGSAALPGPVPDDLALRPAPTDSPPAPAVSGELTDGSPLALADLWAERPVVLTFFSSWCTLCAEQQVAVSDLARAHADRVVFVGVAGEDTAEELQAYLRQHRVGYPVLVDHDQTIWRSYAVREPPAVVLVARGGTLLRGFPGGVDAATLEAMLTDLVLAPAS
ncbi:TlpA family protein disulfide reductase [Solwaraspora sp. WMMB335]|uniref:TlpA family protein disulfide reductase n=1 Tax=Solwaraspora sp. WMMB335 TaxID=3404118 RepID=UPI003B92E13D